MLDKKSQLSSPTAVLTRVEGVRRFPGVRVVRAEQEVAASLEHTFSYFSDPRNLREITPGWLSLVVREMDREQIEQGCNIDYTIRWMQAPLRWRTLIAEHDAPRRFVDTQLRGPYRYWWHEHEFEALDNERTLMRDVVEYAMPLGLLGSVAHALAVGRQLETILRYRASAIARIFPGSGPVVLSRPRRHSVQCPDEKAGGKDDDRIYD